MTNVTSRFDFDNNVTATTIDNATVSLTRHVSPTNPVTVRTTIICILTVFNLCGNGFTLITIKLTPRLWTKTNFILASMMVADIITGIFTFWYIPVLLYLYVFNNPCHYNVVTTIITWLYKVCGYVSVYHLILVSVERYIAIVYPLHYESKFTDRTMKRAICAVWVLSLPFSITWSLWLINDDLSQCNLISPKFLVIDIVVTYIPVCITMFICYGKIFAIAWRQRRQIDPVNAGDLVPGTSGTISQTASSKVESTDDPKQNPLATIGPPVSQNTETTTDQEQQQRQKIKSRRREFKAVYLTATIVGTFVILWFPNALGRILAAIDYDPVVVNYLYLAGGAIGMSNFAFSWAIYAAVSKSYRRAYRQMLIRIGCCCNKNITQQSACDSVIV